jgi:O-antigen ligase
VAAVETVAPPVPAAHRVAGTLSVVLLLGCVRWGSYIGYPPLFLTDLLIAGAVWTAIVRSLGTDPLTRGPRFPAAYFALLLWVLIQGVASLDGRAPLVDWARDLAPYAYAGLAILSASSLTRASEATRERTWWWVKAALAFHAVWMLPQAPGVDGALTQTGYGDLPFVGVPVGVVRPDVDGMILAITAALLLRGFLRGRASWPLLRLLGFAACSAGALIMYSRAALIAYVVVIAVTLYLNVRVSRRVVRTGAVAVAVLLVLGAAVVLPSTTAGQRILSTVGSEEATTPSGSALGTQQARVDAWRGVWAWSGESTERRWLGGGFGNDFVTQAGVASILEGTQYENVRSPHNFLVGTVARLGLIGAGLFVLVWLSALMVIRRQQVAIGADPLATTAALLVVTLPVIAMIGVVLEGPYGAVPFWWAMGFMFFLRGR